MTLVLLVGPEEIDSDHVTADHPLRTHCLTIQLLRFLWISAELRMPGLTAHLVVLVRRHCLSLLHSSIHIISQFLRVKPLLTFPIKQEGYEF